MQRPLSRIAFPFATRLVRSGLCRALAADAIIVAIVAAVSLLTRV